MKLFLSLAIAMMLLTGCAGLSVNWDLDLKATYRSDVPLGERKK